MAEIPTASLLDWPVEALIAGLPSFLAGYVTDEARPAVLASLEAVRADRAEWEELVAYLRVLGDGFEAWRRSPLAARITAAWMEPLIAPTSSITGLEHLDAGLEAMGQGHRLMIVGNHLSYPDVNMLGHLLLRAGLSEVRALLTAVAGPKAYSDPMRRVAAAGINSIKVAQSRHVATGQPELSRREIVRIARHCLGLAERTMDEGRIVLIFPEGTRSRSGRLQPFLRATNRWLSLPGVLLLPAALWGTEAFDAEPLEPAECHARFGPPLDTEELREAGLGRDGILAAAHEAVAALLPEGWAPEPGAARVG